MFCASPCCFSLDCLRNSRALSPVNPRNARNFTGKITPRSLFRKLIQKRYILTRKCIFICMSDKPRVFKFYVYMYSSDTNYTCHICSFIRVQDYYVYSHVFFCLSFFLCFFRNRLKLTEATEFKWIHLYLSLNFWTKYKRNLKKINGAEIKSLFHLSLTRDNSIKKII